MRDACTCTRSLAPDALVKPLEAREHPRITFERDVLNDPVVYWLESLESGQRAKLESSRESPFFLLAIFQRRIVTEI